MVFSKSLDRNFFRKPPKKIEKNVRPQNFLHSPYVTEYLKKNNLKWENFQLATYRGGDSFVLLGDDDMQKLHKLAAQVTGKKENRMLTEKEKSFSKEVKVTRWLYNTFWQITNKCPRLRLTIGMRRGWWVGGVFELKMGSLEGILEKWLRDVS